MDEQVIPPSVHGDQGRGVVAKAPVKPVGDELHRGWVYTLNNRVIAVDSPLERPDLAQPVHLPPVCPIGGCFRFVSVSFYIVSYRIRECLVILVSQDEELCIRFGQDLGVRPKFVGGVEVNVNLLRGTDGQLVVGIEVDVIRLVDVKDLPPCPSEAGFRISGKELNRGPVGEVVLEQGLVPAVGNPPMRPLHNLGEIFDGPPSQVRDGFGHDRNLGLGEPSGVVNEHRKDEDRRCRDLVV